MSVFLSALVPKTGLYAWYPLDNETPLSVGAIQDESGGGRFMLPPPPGIDYPQVVDNVLNGRKGLVFNNDGTFQHAGIVTPLKNIVVVGKVAGSSFSGHDYGLITSIAAGSAIDAFVGTSGGTKWGNAGVFSGYYKSGLGYATSNMQAPFSYFEQFEGVYAGGSELTDGFQLGQVRETPAKYFLGTVCDVMIYTTALTAQYRRRLKLYADLKFRLWLLNGTALEFPSPDITDIPYAHFYAVPVDWDGVTENHQYADGGESFNRATDTPPREWQVSFDCSGWPGPAGVAYAKTLTDIFDAFWGAVGINRPFSFTDKYGVTHTNVRIKRGGYTRIHEANKSWIQKVSFRLRKTGA